MAMRSTAASTGERPRDRVVGLGDDSVVVLLEMTARLADTDPAAALASLGQAAGLLRRRAAKGDPSELTSAEERVAVLAASGRSNQAIATQLFLSVRTVECHLSHAYAKLGLRSKAELAAWWALDVAGALD